MQSANSQNKVSQNIIDHSYYIFMPFTLMHLTGTPDFISYMPEYPFKFVRQFSTIFQQGLSEF